jgi:shikimate 5-dehydrogenase
VVFNRTAKKAVLLAESSRGLGPGHISAGDLPDLTSCGCRAYVHCTTAGMLGGPSPTDIAIPISPLASRDDPPAIIETVYNPLRTPLLQAAEAAGLRAVDGLGMFVRQAALQFELWTGAPAPMRLFERVCRDALAG